MNKYPLKATADELAKRGRYGDTMLVHMNRAEVEGIASLSPTGELTINPDTGQPEAFLPFLAPLMGGMLGSSFIPGLAASAGIGGLSTAAGGAIGSGLANWAATGDLEKGLMSGIMGYGLGSALGAAGAGASGGADALSNIAAPEVGANIAQGAAQHAGSTAAQQAAGSALTEGATQAALQEAGNATASAALRGGMSNLGSAFSNPGGIVKGAMQPGAATSIATGAGMLAEEERMEAYRDAANRRRKGQREDRMAEQQFFDQNLDYTQGHFPQSGNPYGQYSAGYAGGGITSVDPVTYGQMRDGALALARGGPVSNTGGYGLPGNQGLPPGTSGFVPAQRQAALRGPYVNAPPQEYRPGFDPEFLYFSQEPGPRTINPPEQPQGEQPPTASQVPQSVASMVPPDILRRLGISGQLGETPYGPAGGARATPEQELDFSPWQSFGNVNDNSYQSFVQSAQQMPDLSGMVTAGDILAGLEEESADPAAQPAPGNLRQPQPVGDMQMIDPGYGGGALRGGGGGFRLESGRGSYPRLMAEGGMAYGSPRGMPANGAAPYLSAPDIPSAQTFGMGTKGGSDPEVEASVRPVMDRMAHAGMARIPEGHVFPQGETTFYGGADAADPRQSPTFYRAESRNDDPTGGRGFYSRGMPRISHGSAFSFGMADGGVTPDPNDLEMVALAIRGEVDGAEQIIEMFTEKYGPEVFAKVRESVLQTVSPGAQTEGMLRGEGSGMEDGIGALIGSSQPAAVSPGEFIVPADVVSGLGDGSSDSGASRLQDLIDRVRETRTGTREQPAPVNEQELMPE